MIRQYLTTLGVLALVQVAIGQENTWDKMESFPTKRERMASFSIANKGYVSCGKDTILYNDLWEYDPSNDVWTQMADMPGVARRNPIAFSLDGKGYVGTGHDAIISSLGIPLNDFYEYDPVSNSWTQKQDYPGAGGNGVYFATAFATSSRGYVCAGKIAPDNYAADLWEYDPATDNWSQQSGFPGGVRYNLMSFTVNDIGYVGFGIDEDNFRKDLWSFNPAISAWQQMTDCPGAPRGAGGTFTLNGRGFICCGADGGFKEDLWEFDPVTDRWKIRAYFPVDGRRYGFSFAVNNRGYFGAGKGSFGIKRSHYEYEPLSLFGMKLEDEISLYLQENEALEAKIFPNPAANVVHFEWEQGVSIDHIVVTNSLGAEVGVYNVQGNKLDIHRTDEESGNYFLMVFDKDNNLCGTHKLIWK